ncbi:helix-turn-helix domain-containing protein [Janthinobacterium lividum]|uniref:helix-turn-helix domain-containing protein n=1 Tax=Janthinobacterium lividum TaxID=29581 RepID=UPI001F08438B|nr:helix-turn-helix domain-containing protein [Janthinobacterium lividum]
MLAEREEVSRVIVTDVSIRVLARRLGRAPSTISRELRRNGGRETYRAIQADQHAWDQTRRPKPCKLTERRMLANMVDH